MKAEHRHELKTNELADWLAHLPQWAKDNRTTLVAGAAIVVVAVVVYFWIFRHGNIASAQTRVRLTNLVTQLPAQKNSLARALAQQTDQSYLLLDVARDLQDFAETADNDNMAALAWIERAEALRTELHYQLGEVTADERGKRIAQAQTSYQQALERAVGNATLAATARLGLGLCEEELGHYGQAKELYRNVADGPAYEGTVARAAAAFRLQTMDDYRGPVVFKPAPPAQPAASAVPTIQLRPGDANGPQVVAVPADANVGPVLPIGPMLPAGAGDANAPVVVPVPADVNVGPVVPIGPVPAEANEVPTVIDPAGATEANAPADG